MLRFTRQSTFTVSSFKLDSDTPTIYESLSLSNTTFWNGMR